jgi:hypothetical protein
MGLFGKGSDGEANGAEFERLSALPLEDLGKEVMSQVPNIELGALSHGPTARELAGAMAPSRLKADEQVPMSSLVAEGLQVLEQAGLLRSSVRYGSESSQALEFVLTRAGRAALAEGDVRARLGRAPR